MRRQVRRAAEQMNVARPGDRDFGLLLGGGFDAAAAGDGQIDPLHGEVRELGVARAGNHYLDTLDISLCAHRTATRDR